jgi:site-specific recombinase XerC
LLTALGEDPANWDAAGIRRTFMDRASTSARGTVEKMTTGLRAFLRYLAVEGRCRAGLDSAVPAYAHWQLADMPRYLSPEHVNRLIAACDGDAPARRRERAIILLLVRLGLRAGDVAQLRLVDIEWEAGSLQVSGKSRYQVRLPLPQDVGDAIVAYLECRPSTSPSDHVFPRTIAPMPAVQKGRRHLLAGKTRHEASRHRHAIYLKARMRCATRQRPRCCAMACRWRRSAWSSGRKKAPSGPSRAGAVSVGGGAQTPRKR